MSRWKSLAVLVLLLAIAPAFGAGKNKVDLTPASWPAGHLELYSEVNRDWRWRVHPPAETRKGLVVGTTGALAVRSGVEALRQGGSAMDAALTTALAEVTVAGGATVSFAGKLALVHYEAETGEVSYLNGAWQVPRGQTNGFDIPPCGIPSGRQVLVPGFMSALEAAHERFGSLPFKSLFGPAIYFAREGFELHGVLDSWIRTRGDTLTRLPGGRQIFLKPDGEVYAEGDWFRQPRLAKTLKRVSRKGARYMQSGAWARRLVNVVQAEGGRLALEDLAAYEPSWSEPESFKLAGYTYHAPAYPGTGGRHLRAAMSGLPVRRLRAAGHYTDSVEAFGLLLESVERQVAADLTDGSHSDGVLAIDRKGNVVALLHTINTNIWGGTGIFVDGVSISDVGCWAAPWVTLAGPGGRVEGGENPLLVTRKGRPVLASSAVGTVLAEVTMFSLANVLIYALDPQQAVHTPTIHRSTSLAGRVTHRVRPGEFAPDLLEALRDRGFDIREVPAADAGQGWWVGATLDPKSGERFGVTSYAWNGLALAE